MSPEQRQGARAGLAAIEGKAASAEALAAVAHGYLLLDEGGSEAGQSAIRVAGKLQELAPEKSEGYTLTASGYHQSGDYPAATEWARKALKLDPQDDAAIAVFMLSAGRVARGKVDLDGRSAPPPSASEWLVPEETASPQAREFMRKAIKAREAGDFEATMRMAQAAMRSDPSSQGVQEFYLRVAEDHARHTDAIAYIGLAKKAMDAGNRSEALDWARKAVRRSGDPKGKEYLASFEQQVAALPPQRNEVQVPDKKEPGKRGFPIWPIGTALGVTAIGYGVFRAKHKKTSEEGLEPSPEVPPGQARQNYFRSALIVGGLLLAVAAWEFGPAAWTAVRTLLAAAGPIGAEMAPQFVGAGAAGGASAGVIPLGEAGVGVAKAGLATAGAHVSLRAVSEGINYAKSDGQNESSSKVPEGRVGKPSVESRIKEADLPSEGDFRFEPPKRYHPGNPLPRVTERHSTGFLDQYGNVWRKGNYHGKPGMFNFEWDVQLSKTGKRMWGRFSRGKDYINVRPDGMLSH
jgi:tetratricopeptide (TPR) repeat protein